MKKMITDTFSRLLPAWIDAPDMDNGSDTITLMSSVRVRRNIDGFPFPVKCGRSELYDAAALVLGSIGRSETWEGCDFRMIDNLDTMSRNLLLEIRVITPLLINGGPGRFLLRDGDGKMSCMVNEEDHVSVSVMKTGLDPSSALKTFEEMEASIDINFARDSVLGYLTADPSYVGTGLTVSVLLHLPALDMLGEMPRICDSFIRDWKKLTLSRFFSDRENGCGSFYLISNRVTLAAAPADIVNKVTDSAHSLSSKELFARHKIRSSKNGETADKFWRAWGILRHARRLSFGDAVNMLSLIKLGSDMGILPYISNREWKRMVLGAQKYHMYITGQDIIREQTEETWLRAAIFRRFIEKKSHLASFDMPEQDKEL
jgi:protein arginine kinase